MSSENGARFDGYILGKVKINATLPQLSESKQANAFLMTSSGSVPFSFSPKSVRNIVKLSGPTNEHDEHREVDGIYK